MDAFDKFYAKNECTDGTDCQWKILKFDDFKILICKLCMRQIKRSYNPLLNRGITEFKSEEEFE